MKQHIIVNQWKNTMNVADWFNNIKSKNNCAFTQFDIVEFYPSISEDLFMKSLNYAKTLKTVTDLEINIIMHSRKSLLFNNEEPWVTSQRKGVNEVKCKEDKNIISSEHFKNQLGTHSRYGLLTQKNDWELAKFPYLYNVILCGGNFD